MKYVNNNETIAVITHTIANLPNEEGNDITNRYGIIGRSNVKTIDGIITLKKYEMYE